MHAVINSKSIAVLPFINIGSDENEYFSDGISEEIINALTKIEGLKVTARTSSFFYKNKSLDARHIGNELGVETLLEGSVRIINERVRITAQLIRTDNGFHMWSENFDRKLSDIFELQDEISLLIADKIRENFGHFELQEHLVIPTTKNIEAYQKLLKGRELRMRWNGTDVTSAIAFFDESIELDPQYPDAYFEKGWCIGMLASWGYMDKTEGLVQADRNIDIGLQLNPDSSIGHYAKGTISFWGYWNYKDAFKHLERSLEINPNAAEIRDALADCYAGLGNIDKALENNAIALRINPLSANLHFTHANLVYFKKQFKDAIIHLNKALNIDPTFPLAHEMMVAALIFDNQPEALKNHIEKNSEWLSRPKCCMAIYDLMYKVSRFKISDIEISHEQNKKSLPLRAWDLYLEVYRNNHFKALNILTERINARSGQLFSFQNDLFLQPLHNYEDYQSLVAIVFQSSVIPKLKQKTISTDKETPFTEDELSNAISSLEKAMTLGKEYCKPELSLKQLAFKINLHPNKLSWLLNNHFGKNFNDFINHYRIKEFQQLAVLPENKHITLLGLAYDSGFNSKTVFNTFFKKETGKTPKQWVKANS